MTIVSIYAVFRDHEEAERIGRVAIEERLAACVNIIGPIHSIYRWNDAVESADEFAAIFKTSEQGADTLITRIGQLHSYEVPCVVAWPIERTLPSYEAFVEANVT